MDDQVTATKKRKFTLIELLMILMLVGIIFTLVIPMVEDRRNNERVIEAIRDVTIIREANQRFREGPGEGFYAFDISQLNVDELLDMNYFNRYCNHCNFYRELQCGRGSVILRFSIQTVAGKG